MTERILTSEHVARLIETGKLYYRNGFGSHDFSSRTYESDTGDSETDIDERTGKPFYLSEDYFFVWIKINLIFPNRVSLYRGNTFVPIENDERDRIVAAFRTWQSAKKEREALEAKGLTEKQQRLRWWP